MPPEIGTDRARQARRGTPVLVVAIAGLVLAGIAWFIVSTYFSTAAPVHKTFEAEQNNTENAPPPSPTKHLDNPSQATPQQNGAAPPAGKTRQ